MGLYLMGLRRAGKTVRRPSFRRFAGWFRRVFLWSNKRSQFLRKCLRGLGLCGRRLLRFGPLAGALPVAGSETRLVASFRFRSSFWSGVPGVGGRLLFGRG